MRLVVVKCSFIAGIEMYIFDRTPAASDILCVDFEASLVLCRCIATKSLNIVYIKESFPFRKLASIYNSLLRSPLKVRWKCSGFLFLFLKLIKSYKCIGKHHFSECVDISAIVIV